MAHTYTDNNLLLGDVAQFMKLNLNSLDIASNECLAYVGGQILNSDRLMNDFVKNMLNRIGETILNQKIFTNPFSDFKRGFLPAGAIIEDIFVNPQEPHDFQDGSTTNNETTPNPYAIENPDIKVLYYPQNSRKYYKVTVKEAQLIQAFTSWDSMNSFIDTTLVGNLQNSREIYEFEQVKSLLGYAFNLPVQPMVGAEVSEVDNVTFATDFVKTCRKLAIFMKFANTNYNNYVNYATSTGLQSLNLTPVKTFTHPEDLKIILRGDIGTIIDVDVLATAFNRKDTDFIGQVYYTDDFGSCEVETMGNTANTKYHLDGNLGNYDVLENGTRYHYELLAVVCDKSFIRIWDNFQKVKSIENQEGLYTNYILHHWQTYGLCCFANAVAIYSKTVIE